MPTNINNFKFHLSQMQVLSRGARDSKIGKKVAGKYQNFRLYPPLVWCFRSVKTDIAQILSLAKDVYLWGNHSYPHAGFM